MYVYVQLEFSVSYGNSFFHVITLVQYFKMRTPVMPYVDIYLPCSIEYTFRVIILTKYKVKLRL